MARQRPRGNLQALHRGSKDHGCIVKARKEKVQTPLGEHSEPQHWRGKTSSAACRDGVARSGLESDVACGSSVAPTRVGPDSSQGVSARLGRAATALFRVGSAFATDGFV